MMHIFVAVEDACLLATLACRLHPSSPVLDISRLTLNVLIKLSVKFRHNDKGNNVKHTIDHGGVDEVKG